MKKKSARKGAPDGKKVLNEIDQGSCLHRALNAATPTTATASQLQLNKLGSYHLFIEVLCGKAKCNIGLFRRREEKTWTFSGSVFASPVAVHHNQMTE